MPDKGWHHPLHDSIPLPKGAELQTLRDAGNFIAKLPKREHDAPEWRAAIQALMPVATHGGDTMLRRGSGSCRRCTLGGAPPRAASAQGNIAS